VSQAVTVGLSKYRIFSERPINYLATFSGDCDSNGDVEITVPSQIKTCTVTNTAKPITQAIQ
jgi:hypothetical protein